MEHRSKNTTPITVWKKLFLTFLQDYAKTYSYSPTLYEISKETENWGRPITVERVRQILQEMEKDGTLTVTKSKFRGIKLTQSPHDEGQVRGDALHSGHNGSAIHPDREVHPEGDAELGGSGLDTPVS